MIELLVVIAIIAILAAILFPVFGRARENARRSSCASNMKQLGLGLAQYYQDYDERGPVFISAGVYYGGWAGQIFPYVKSTQIYQCPSDSFTSNQTAFANIISYTGNPNAICPQNSPGISLAAFQAPSLTVMLFETSGHIMPTDSANWANESRSAISWIENSPNGGWFGPAAKLETGPLGNPVYTAANYDTAAPNGRHLEGSNYVFADGHVKWLKGVSVSAGQGPTFSTPQSSPYACSTDRLSTGNFAATFSVR